MGLCAGRDKPKHVLEINDDLVTKQAAELINKRKYGVEQGNSQEEALVSIAANMQAMRENVRTKSACHLNKVQRVRKLQAFGGLMALVQKGLKPQKAAAS